MITLPSKPVVFTELLPSEIIGYANMPQFTQHMKIAFNRIDGDWPAKEISKLGEGTRKMVAEALRHLFENGFVVNGIGGDGKVRFGVRLRSASDDIFEGPELRRLEKMTERELQTMGRKGYLHTVENVAVVPATQNERDFAGITL